MPPILSKPSSAAPTALVFITLGALLTVWSGLWFVYLQNNPPAQKFIYYLDTGFLLSGLVFLAIGFFLGPVARMARQAELPPGEVTPTIVQREVEQRV
jgi:ABC-type transport system involved in multi-copper enzyme maturation permease subunit